MSKKMCAKASSHALIEVIGYSYPTYHETKKCYVDFYYLDPYENRIRRKKYHLDNIKDRRKRRAFSHKLIFELCVKLASGWRPWKTVLTEEKQYVTLEECFKKYKARVDREGSIKTVRAYSTFGTAFLTYVRNINQNVLYCQQITPAIIGDFLDYLSDEKKLQARTRNNYRSWLFSFFEWMLKRKYIDENPVKDSERLRESKKKRKSLTPKMLQDLFEYLKDRDPYFLLAVMMEYYTFIRPNELHYIKIEDINLKEMKIFVSEDYTKSRRDDCVALNKTVIMQMLECGLFNHPSNYYIFGRNLRPGLKKSDYNIFNRKWSQVRKAMGWGLDIQFYSLKDSGIRDLANSEGIVTAKQQARHTDIATTNKYLVHAGPNAPEEAKQFKGAFYSCDQGNDQ